MITRPYAEEDAAAIADLYNAIEGQFGSDTPYTEGGMRSRMSVHADEWATNTRLLWTADGQLVAAGYTEAPPPGGDKAYVDGGVHPRWRGHGIGRELLAWQLERASEIHREQAPEAQWVADGGALVEDESALRMLERFGMTPVRYFFDMEAPVGSIEGAPLPGGLRIAEFTSDRGHQLYDAHMEAFSDHWGFQKRPYDKWVKYTVESEMFRPDLSRLVFDGNEIAAYVLSYDGAGDTLYIGQVGTRRAWRRRGLASMVLANVLSAGDKAGRSKAELGVDADNPTGAVGVYTRVGFEATKKFVAYSKKL